MSRCRRKAAALLPCILLMWSAPCAAQFQHHSLTFDSRILGETRSAEVRLPDACHDTTAPCPVLYLLDGESSDGMLAVVDSLTRNGQIPEMLLIAIPNTNRVRDLSPSPTEERRQGGGAPHFLRFVQEELIPEIERAYAPGSPRIIFGHSLGGLFVTYALIAGSGYFDGYIAASPPLHWGDSTVLRMAGETLQGSSGWNATYLLSVGGEDWPEFRTSTRDFATWLEGNAPAVLDWSYRVYDGEDHGSVGYVALAHGLLHLFSSLDPSRVPCSEGME